MITDDHSRVKLLPTEDDEEGSDYINANYMPVSKQDKHTNSVMYISKHIFLYGQYSHECKGGLIPCRL